MTTEYVKPIKAGTVVYKKCPPPIGSGCDFIIVKGILTGEGKAFNTLGKKCRGPGIFVTEMTGYTYNWSTDRYRGTKFTGTAISMFNSSGTTWASGRHTKYQLFKISKPHRYEKDDIQCAAGLHFYLTKRQAMKH